MRSPIRPTTKRSARRQHDGRQHAGALDDLPAHGHRPCFDTAGGFVLHVSVARHRAHVGATGYRGVATCAAGLVPIGSSAGPERSAMIVRPHAGHAPTAWCWHEGSVEREGRCDACGRPRHAAGCVRARPPTGLTAPRPARRFFRTVKGRTDGEQNDAAADTVHDQAIASRAARDGLQHKARPTIWQRTDTARLRYRQTSIARTVSFFSCSLLVPAPTRARLRSQRCYRRACGPLAIGSWHASCFDIAPLLFLRFSIDSVSGRHDRRLDKRHVIDREARGADACARESHVGSFFDENGRIVRLVARRRAENSRDRTATRAGRFGRKVIGNVER